MSTRSEAVSNAGRVLAATRAAQAQMTPREQAEAAWEPTCGKTVEDIEDQIRDQRGLPRINRRAKTA